jgi:hypothetical protein
MAENASYCVTHLPLRPEIRAQFDNEAAQNFFWETEGLSYGNQNLIYGLIDTESSNLLGLLPNYLLPVIFSLVEAIAP